MPRGIPKSGKRKTRKMVSDTKAQTMDHTPMPKGFTSAVNAARKALDKLESFVQKQQRSSLRQGATAAGPQKPAGSGKRKGRKQREGGDLSL